MFICNEIDRYENWWKQWAISFSCISCLNNINHSQSNQTLKNWVKCSNVENRGEYLFELLLYLLFITKIEFEMVGTEHCGSVHTALMNNFLKNM